MESKSVQPQNEGFFDVLDACCKQIVQKMGGKPISEWRIADYNTLSSQLGKQTKVYLSENTLKRIFGRLKTPKRYYPQKATRDALAQFVGYRDWQEYEVIHQSFKDKNVEREKETEPFATTPAKILIETEAAAEPEAKVESPIVSIKSILVVMLSLIIISTCLIYVFKDNYVNVDDVSLVCENPVGQVPHTAVFKLSSKKPIDNDENFTIDFMDEGTKTKISNKQIITQFFRNPGVVYVKLLHKGRVIDTTTVFMQTKGWVANSGNDTIRAFPIAGLRSLSKDNIYVSTKQLDSAGLDVSKPFLVGFSNIHSSLIDGDNFQFSCNLQSEESRPGVQCIETTIIILGEHSRHLITLYKPSCAAFSQYNFSEVVVKGTSTYLGKMGYDFKDGGQVVLKVKNKKVILYIQGKKVLSTNYKKSIGKVMGIKILFNGIGKVSNPKLNDLKTNMLF